MDVISRMAELLRRRTAVMTELRRVKALPIARLGELETELESLQHQIDAALAEAAKETPQ